MAKEDMYPVTIAQMKMMWNNWKHYYPEDLIEAKVNSKVSFLLFVSIVMK